MTDLPRWRIGPWLPIPFYLAAVLALSAFTVPSTPWNISDKLAHVLEFAGLAALVSRAVLSQFPREPLPSVMVIGALFACGCGAIDEWVQSFAPLRTSDLADLAADAVGGVLGAGLFVLATAMWRSQTSKPSEPLSADE